MSDDERPVAVAGLVDACSMYGVPAAESKCARCSRAVFYDARNKKIFDECELICSECFEPSEVETPVAVVGGETMPLAVGLALVKAIKGRN